MPGFLTFSFVHGLEEAFMRLRIAAIAASLVLVSAHTAFAVDCGGDFDSWKKGFEAEAAQRGVGEKGRQALDGVPGTDGLLRP